MLIKLQPQPEKAIAWTQTGGNLWTASVIPTNSEAIHGFSIIKADDDTFSMLCQINAAPSTRLGNFRSLAQAQHRARQIVVGAAR